MTAIAGQMQQGCEGDLVDALSEAGVGCIVFSPLAQGVLTDRYLSGIPAGSRASRPGMLPAASLSEGLLARVRALNEVARTRGQTLAQLGLAWTLRDPRITSALAGASSIEQLEQNVAALERLAFPRKQAAIDLLLATPN